MPEQLVATWKTRKPDYWELKWPPTMECRLEQLARWKQKPWRLLLVAMSHSQVDYVLWDRKNNTNWVRGQRHLATQGIHRTIDMGHKSMEILMIIAPIRLGIGSISSYDAEHSVSHRKIGTCLDVRGKAGLRAAAPITRVARHVSYKSATWKWIGKSES